MAKLRRSLGVMEAFGFSLSLIAPTMAMAFNTTLMAQSAGRAVPLACLIGGVAVTLIGLSFVAFSRRIANAGSVYAYIGAVLGSRHGFVIGWVLLLGYVAGTASATALVGNFGAAALGHVGIEGSGHWLFIAVLGGVFATWLAWRDMQVAARLMLVLEAVSVLAMLILAVVVLTQVPLSLQPFQPEPGHGWTGVGFAIGFAVLAFAGFEGATTLGEETSDPGRTIPFALIGTVAVALVFYVFVSYAQVLGYGIENAGLLAQASAPLDELSTRFVSGGFAGFLDIAAATSAVACTIGGVSAAARMLFALSRAGLVPGLDAVDPRHGTPARAVCVMGAVNVTCLLVFGIGSDAASYTGAVATVGTLALILVYMGVAAAQAIDAFRGGRPVWCGVGCIGAVLLAWPLWNSVFPVPAWPGYLWPCVVAAWLLAGVLIARFGPRVTLFDASIPEAAE